MITNVAITGSNDTGLLVITQATTLPIKADIIAISVHRIALIFVLILNYANNVIIFLDTDVTEHLSYSCSVAVVSGIGANMLYGKSYDIQMFLS